VLQFPDVAERIAQPGRQFGIVWYGEDASFGLMDEDQLSTLLEFLRFPSISTDLDKRNHVAACAQWLATELVKMGLTATVHKTAGHPIVVAKNEHRTNRRTVMIYGHYDVQPIDPLELWENPPFEPKVTDEKIYARGATDNKGQIMAHILGVKEALKENGDLPVNLTILVEGEEEIGSPNLEPFLKQHYEELRPDVIAISDTGMVAPGVPTFTYGLRGIAVMELKVTGPASDLHSGIYGGAVANPATALARLLATLHDETGSVAVRGFYDSVLPIEDWEREAWRKLPFGDDHLLEITGAPMLWGETGFTALERIWARPTAEVNGIGGGFQGEGTKTVLPKEAFAKLTFRLVPNQLPEEICGKVEAHLREYCQKGVNLEIKLGHSGKPYRVSPDSRDGLAAQRALNRTFRNDIALVREGGSIPIVQSFKDVLGTDTLLLGLALPDARLHAPNENFSLENFYAGIRLNKYLLEELARI
jgi:acetylornithine deacetylase/succinyl-diaminopimelate desuccinylase-like protein